MTEEELVDFVNSEAYIQASELVSPNSYEFSSLLERIEEELYLKYHYIL